jgi:death-on-curing protein
MRRVELGDFLVIASIHTGVDAHRLARMPRVVQLGGAALAAPFAGFGDVELFPDFHAKAAVYASRVIRYHPLPDGNKRTAYDVMVEFIERNGSVLVHGEGGFDETAEAIERLASESMGEPEFIEWVRARIGPERPTR